MKERLGEREIVSVRNTNIRSKWQTAFYRRVQDRMDKIARASYSSVYKTSQNELQFFVQKQGKHYPTLYYALDFIHTLGYTFIWFECACVHVWGSEEEIR